MPQEYLYTQLPIEVSNSKELNLLAKIIFGDILLLSKKSGSCWAKNSFFVEKYGYENNTIRRAIGKLCKANFLSVCIENGNKRTLTPINFCGNNNINQENATRVTPIRIDAPSELMPHHDRWGTPIRIDAPYNEGVLQDDYNKTNPLYPPGEKEKGENKITSLETPRKTVRETKRETMQEKEIDEQHRHWYDLFKHYTLNTIRSKIKDNDQAIDSLLEMCGPKGLEDALIALQYARGRPKNKPYWVGFVNNYVNLRRNIDNVMGFAATKVQEELAYQQER